MLNYLNIDRNRTTEQNLEEIRSWAYQTIDQLNYELDEMQKKIISIENEMKGAENG